MDGIRKSNLLSKLNNIIELNLARALLLSCQLQESKRPLCNFINEITRFTSITVVEGICIQIVLPGIVV